MAPLVTKKERRMQCAACQGENPETNKFCGTCGAPLVHVCPACGVTCPPAARFCGECGHQLDQPRAQSADANQPGDDTAAPVLPAGERRQVTVLFVDLCDFTQLSVALGAEETHDLLNRYFAEVDAAVEACGGSIDKHIGDAAMAVFGAPIAHDDDPLRAARAALDIHAALARLADQTGFGLKVHAGLAAGEVVASGTGSDHHREYTVTGDTVNLASRLQDLAAPGETLFSDSMYQAVALSVQAVAMDNVPLKGFDASLKVWRLEGVRDERKPVAWGPCVGRDGEIAQFQGALQACRASGRGQVMVLRGEAGIGKTRLLESLRAEAANAGFDCHTGYVLDFGAATGGDAVRAVCASLLATSPAAASASRHAAVRAAQAAGDVAEADLAFLSDLLNLPVPDDMKTIYDAMDAETRAAGRDRVLGELVRRRAANTPLLLVIEDVHWAESALLGRLGALASVVSDCPVLVVMTSRIEGDPLDAAWRARLDWASFMTVDLGPLRGEDAMTVALARLGAGDVGLAESCVARAEGNPLFLDQLLHMGEAGGADAIVADEAVPSSIQSLVQARLDRLSEDDRHALQAASVIGQHFSLEAVCHVMGQTHYAPAALIENRLIREGGGAWLFGHALIRDGVYKAQPRATRRSLHARAADWFAGRDPVLHAEHLDRAGAPEAPAAYLAAARTEAGAYRLQEAARLAARGAHLADDPALAFGLRHFAGETLRELGDIERATDTFEQALAGAPDGTARCRAWIGLAGCMRIVDRMDEGLEFLDRAEIAAEADTLNAELSDIHYLRGNFYFPLGRTDDCLHEHEQARHFGQLAGQPEAEARALGGLGDAYYLRGQMGRAEDHFNRCVELCRQNGFERLEVINLAMRANTRAYQLRTADAIDDYRDGAALARRIGHKRALIISLMGGDSNLDTGDYVAAREALEGANSVAAELGARRFLTWGQVFLAKIIAEEGEPARALDMVNEAVAIARETGFSFLGPLALGVRGLLTNDASVRQASFEEAEAVLAQGCVGHNYFHFYRDAMEASLRAGEWGEVARFADALATYTRADPMDWSDFYIARARVLEKIGRGDADDGVVAELDRLENIIRQARLDPARRALDVARAQL